MPQTASSRSRLRIPLDRAASESRRRSERRSTSPAVSSSDGTSCDLVVKNTSRPDAVVPINAISPPSVPGVIRLSTLEVSAAMEALPPPLVDIPTTAIRPLLLQTPRLSRVAGFHRRDPVARAPPGFRRTRSRHCRRPTSPVEGPQKPAGQPDSLRLQSVCPAWVPDQTGRHRRRHSTTSSRLS